MTATDIAHMTAKEKLEAIEMLWDSLKENARDVEPPAWHGEVLAQRMEKIKNGTAKSYTLEEVRKHFGR